MSSMQNEEKTYIKNTIGKFNAHSLCSILFFGCFFIAIFVANTIWKNEAAWIGYIYESSILNFSSQKLNTTELLQIVFFCRAPIWVILVFLGRTLTGVLVAEVYGAWQGFAIGFSMAAFVIRFGISGIIIFGASLFPQIIFYTTAYGLLFRMIFTYAKRKHENEMHRENVDGNEKMTAIFCAVEILLSIVFAVGVFMESYVNVMILKKIACFLINN